MTVSSLPYCTDIYTTFSSVLHRLDGIFLGGLCPIRKEQVPAYMRYAMCYLAQVRSVQEICVLSLAGGSPVEQHSHLTLRFSCRWKPVPKVFCS